MFFIIRYCYDGSLGMISERERLGHPRVFKGVFLGVFAVSFYSPTICEFLWRVLQYANHMAVFGPVWHDHTPNGSRVSVQDANPALPALESHLFSLWTHRWTRAHCACLEISTGYLRVFTFRNESVDNDYEFEMTAVACVRPG